MFEKYSRVIEYIYGPIQRVEQVTGQLPSMHSRLVISARAISFLFRNNLITRQAADLQSKDLKSELKQPREHKTFAEIRPRFVGHIAAAPIKMQGLSQLIDAAENVCEMHRHPVSGAMIRVDDQGEGRVDQKEVPEPDVETIANLMDFTIEKLIETENDS